MSLPDNKKYSLLACLPACLPTYLAILVLYIAFIPPSNINLTTILYTHHLYSFNVITIWIPFTRGSENVPLLFIPSPYISYFSS